MRNRRVQYHFLLVCCQTKFSSKINTINVPQIIPAKYKSVICFAFLLANEMCDWAYSSSPTTQMLRDTTHNVFRRNTGVKRSCVWPNIW